MTYPSDEDFLAEVDGVVSTCAARRRASGPAAWGEGDDRVSVVAERTEGEAAEIAAQRRYRALLAEHDLAWVEGPVEFGGRNLPPRYADLLRSVEASYDLPDDGYLRFSLATLCPTLLEHGTGDQRTTYLRRLRSAEIIACQLYSEPGAGSDLAAVSTRAVRDGSGWVLEGQKVWSSGAHHSEIGLCVARTDPAAPKHRGLTTFLVDMSDPGVEVRPIRQLTGGASFDEVFLTGVRVPDVGRVGEVNGGWPVVVTSLLNERSAIGREVGVDEVLVNRLIELAEHVQGSVDDRTRDRLADIVVRSWAARETTAGLLDGGVPGPELALAKLLTTDILRSISDVAGDVLAMSHACDTGEWGTFAWSELTLGLPGLRIGGGTDEILKNAIGERVLRLPKDKR